LIFLIDTLYFAFGYSVESKSLNNKIRSIEPTALGWVVALICYPPFNSMFTRYTNWHADIYILLSNSITTFIIKILILTLFLFYISATLSLGTKCSNLTNRGIITRGPYSIVRHPAYISKNIAWWIAIIPIISWTTAISMFIWSSLYHLRAITEERHLSQDPEYLRYCKKVKYKYIPYIY
ncbi:methyltransferase family protein, partial [Bacteroidota bacterium]